MKLNDHLRQFLVETVNLNATRIETLEKRVKTIKEYLTASDYGATIRGFSAQGSWSHKTIIKPATEKKEFDADLVVYLDPVAGWTPAKYVVDLRRAFWASSVYRDLASFKSRCVKLNYAGDFHLDVVPIVVEKNWFGDTSLSVCNRVDDEFEPTDGDGFGEWWIGRDNVIGGSKLIEAARLIKYIRDFKGRFAIKSVLLTTLIGMQIKDEDQFNLDPFADLATTLTTVMRRLDDWLQARALLPFVENPKLPGESFTRSLTQEGYDTIRENITRYRGWIDEAFNEADRDESIRKWRRVFGSDYARGETEDRAIAAVTKVAEALDQTTDIVASVVRFGKAILNRIPANLPYVQLPTFRQEAKLLPVYIRAVEKPSRDGAAVRDFASGDTIDPGRGGEFRAVQANGLPFPTDFQVRWQVVNTGSAARAEKSLRGDFYDSSPHGYRWEDTRYRGAHWVQAFVENPRRGTVAGISDRFFVVIR